MGTVCRGRVGNTAVAAWKQVTELEGYFLQIIRRVALVIMNYIVVTRLASSLVKREVPTNEIMSPKPEVYKPVFQSETQERSHDQLGV